MMNNKFLWLVLLLPLLFSCQKYNKAPFDEIEKKLRNTSNETTDIILDENWQKRDSLSYLRFKNVRNIYFKETDSIPNWIVNFKSLKSIESFPNKKKINYIPKHIGKLKQLTHIELPKNNISKIPHSLYLLKNLQRLNLIANKITEIDSSIDKLQEITIILLSDNIRLNFIPENICNLQNLKSLPLDGTSISYLPQCIKNMQNLERINISNSKIKNINKDILEAKNLKTINAKGIKLDNYKEVKEICEKRNIAFYYDE